MADTNGVVEEAPEKIEGTNTSDVPENVEVKTEPCEEPVKTEPIEEKPADIGDGDTKPKIPLEDQKIKVEEIKPIGEPTELSPEVLAKRVKRQIEYYFGDFNLPTDKFLQSVVKEKNGWVPIATLLTFNRLNSLTKDPKLIVDVLQGSQIVQISEDKTELRRNPDKPLPEESEARRKEVLARSIYVKGFPQEGFNMDSALDFFEQFGPTDDVVMRFWQDKAEKKWKFKGSVFIKFPTKEAAQAFLDLKEVKFEGTTLEKMWQGEYLENKRKERLDQKMLKRKNADDPQDNKGNKRIKLEENKGLPKNATLHIDKCPEGLSREILKEKVEELGVTVAFIDYNKGDEQAWIRLHEEGTAAKVMEACKGDLLTLGEDLQVSLRTLVGEEEEKFLESARQSISARRSKGQQRGGKRGGRGGSRGGKGGQHWRNRRKNQDSQNNDVKMEGNEVEGD